MAYRVKSLAALALALVTVGAVSGCDIMRGDQIVFVVDDNDDNSVEASVDNEAVEVQSRRLGLHFSEIEMTILRANVGVMSKLNKDSDYTIRAHLMVPAPFTIVPANITISLESQTQDGKWTPHVVEVAEHFPWRQQGTPEGKEQEEQVWWAHFHAVPDLKASENERVRLRIQVVLDGPNGTQHDVDCVLILRKKDITIPRSIVFRFSGEDGTPSLSDDEVDIALPGPASRIAFGRRVARTTPESCLGAAVQEVLS